jgi:hypothetical protein
MEEVMAFASGYATCWSGRNAGGHAAGSGEPAQVIFGTGQYLWVNISA